MTRIQNNETLHTQQNIRKWHTLWGHHIIKHNNARAWGNGSTTKTHNTKHMQVLFGVTSTVANTTTTTTTSPFGRPVRPFSAPIDVTHTNTTTREGTAPQLAWLP